MAELWEHHQVQMVNYLRFARYQRAQQVSDAQANFEDAIDGLDETTYTKKEVKKMLDSLCDIVKNDIDRELAHVAHTNVVLLQQMFAEAEHWHLKLHADVKDLENKKKLDAIRKFEDDYVVRSKQLSSKQGPDGKGPTAGLTRRIAELEKELEKEKKSHHKAAKSAAQAAEDVDHLERYLEALKDRINQTDPQLASRIKELRQTGIDLDTLQEQLEALEASSAKGKRSSTKVQAELTDDIGRLKKDLLKRTAELEKAQRDLDLKFSNTTQYQNMKKMLLKKNSTIKKLRATIDELDPDYSEEEDSEGR